MYACRESRMGWKGKRSKKIGCKKWKEGRIRSFVIRINFKCTFLHSFCTRKSPNFPLSELFPHIPKIQVQFMGMTFHLVRVINISACSCVLSCVVRGWELGIGNRVEKLEWPKAGEMYFIIHNTSRNPPPFGGKFMSLNLTQSSAW